MSNALGRGTIKPEYIVEIILSRRWFIIIPFCIAMIVGTWLAITLPKLYEASTLILVEAQRVPEDFVQSIVSSDVDARINTISQQILSRTNLEKIIEQLSLFSSSEYENMFMEDKVASMRKRITVDVTRSRSRNTESFSISFRGKNPEDVAKVVNTIATLFINENLKVRETLAYGTRDFLEGELYSIRKTLEDVEETMKEYRKRYMGELPEQLESNLRILERIQEQVSEREQRLSDVKNRLALIDSQITPPQRSSTFGRDAGGAPTIEQLREELAGLKMKYTDNHPDILRLKKMIAEIKKDAEVSVERYLQGEYPETSAGLLPANVRQRNEILQEIMSLEKDIKTLRSQRKKYEIRIENIPKREQELMSLRRDYQDIKEAYSSLLSRKLEAEIAANMEKKQKGERFRVIDSAKVPLKPVEPDMMKLFLLSIAAGLGIGGGIIFLLEYTDTSFKRTEEIESFLGVPVIATIPKIYQQKDFMLKKAHLAFSILFIVISGVLFIGLYAVTLVGVENTLNLMKRLIIL